MRRKLIVILGMHRSGTSALTRGLQVLGVNLGQSLMGRVEGINDKGFWEDEDIVHLNEEILAFIGHRWHSLAPLTESELATLYQSQFMDRAVETLASKVSQGTILGLKDPRFCKLLVFWLKVFDQLELDVRYIIATRNPVSVKESLTARDKFDPRKSYYLWLQHVLTPLSQPSVITNSIVVDFDDLLAAPKQQLQRIADRFDLALDESAYLTYSQEFLEEGLRHSVHLPNAVDSDPDCPPQVRETYRWLRHLAGSDNANDLHELDTKILPVLHDIERFSQLFALVNRYDRELRTLRSAFDSETESARNALVSLRAKLESDGADWAAAISARDEEVQRLKQEINALSGDLDRAKSYKVLAKERSEQLEQLKATNKSQAAEILHLQEQLSTSEGQRIAAESSLNAIRGSRIWRSTAPVRRLGNTVRRSRSTASIVKQKIAAQGGVVPTVRKVIAITKTHGLAGLQHRLRTAVSSRVAERVFAVERPAPSIPFRPYYLNPYYEITDEDTRAAPSVALHLHLFHEDLIGQISGYLNNCPYSYDLYVSVQEGSDRQALKKYLSDTLAKASAIIVEEVPNRGRDIAPFIIQFGKRLQSYEFVGHIHSKKSPHSRELSSWLTHILGLLFGNPGSDGRELVQIFNLLRSGAKVVYPEGPLSIAMDRSGWSDNFEIARELLARYTSYRAEDFPIVEFPQGTMFWARGDRIVDLLNLPLSWEDFPQEPIPADGTIAHAIERLILVLTSRFDGQCIKLHKGDSTVEYPYYEDQIDFSSKLGSDTPKVLAYYLPQFHPTPENDEWHGEGFTEWYKVRAANPLFAGHYQQHIPHPDIGYYLLDSPATLEKQANLMKKAGVYGQIFYHYWFGGRLILEKPAQMLLANPQIEMPYCFCWANENWTRRWDGNESEILLAQDYSEQDAGAFIRYLMPFFRDPRYITIEGRPVLMVYRASSIPDAQLYVEVWAKECEAQGIPRPYVVAVLTRGATDPRDFGMDAGTERVLHDWTGGGCPEISSDLPMFGEFGGSALSYDDVSAYYMSQDGNKPFTYFRSIVPIWDNTARYGEQAYLVHGSTPSKFQAWMERLVEQSRRDYGPEKRFIIVNAWNEWAEGAHLEPDTRYGYAYLNSVGRALTGQPFGVLRTAGADSLSAAHIRIDISDYAKGILNSSPRLRERFVSCLSNSTILRKCSVEFADPTWAAEMAQLAPDYFPPSSTGTDFTHTIVVGCPSVFSPEAIEEMVRMSLEYPSAAILANSYGAGEEMNAVGEAMSVDRWQAHSSPFRLFPRSVNGDYKTFKICPKARFYIAPPDTLEQNEQLQVVTTIIRFHKSATLDELENALLSLYAMSDCIVVPHIAAQDLSEQQKAQLDAMVTSYKWHYLHPPVITHYSTPDGTGDLRSRMLNESLRQVRTRYAAFLDYDDRLFPTAYAQLLHRLRVTGKAVTFGRVYCALFDAGSQRITERRRLYEYGLNYLDFLRANHAPIHSFMLDMYQIELEHVIWHEDQKYMEDYLLTLQIFNEENCDWESLSAYTYIGDYMHKSNGSNTLAISDLSHRESILNSGLYRLCEARIIELQRSKWE